MSARTRDPDPTRVPENVTSPLLPGGDLISASLDRQVMIWSDRGGASRHIGDRWAIRCAEALDEAVGVEWPVPLGESFTLVEVIRLDDVPEVSREANLHHLENPDFILIGTRAGDERAVLQAVDAKFAADRIKPSQVSADVLLNLISLPNGATRTLVNSEVARLGFVDPQLVRGVFVAPRSVLTDHLLRRVTSGRRATVDPREVVTVPPDPDSLFAGLGQSRLIGSLARMDALPVTPKTNVISTIYYFRLACACFFLWGEENRPLLTNRPADEPEPGVVAAELAARVERATSAYDLVASWAADVEPATQARQAIADVAILPVRMREIRSMLEQAHRSGENKVLRGIRRDLEVTFKQRLRELIGEIAADDPRPLTAILDDVAQASLSLAPAMNELLGDLIVAAPLRDTPAE